MGHLVKVDGIEINATVRAQSLECDECNDQYNGGNGEDKAGPIKPNGYRSITPTDLIWDAKRLGWTGLEKYETPPQGKAPPDLCPVCSAMKRAPYWPTLVHEPIGSLIIAYQPTGPLVQRHVLVAPLERRKIGVGVHNWPGRSRVIQAPAIIDVKIVAQEMGPLEIDFLNIVRWPGHKAQPPFKAKSPTIRLWSWGDGKVYAKEVSH
jgi:hypothetical protein